MTLTLLVPTPTQQARLSAIAADLRLARFAPGGGVRMSVVDAADNRKAQQ